MISDVFKEKSSWEYIKSSNKPVLIYGMGNGADKVIDELNRLEIDILGITASDEFVRHQQFRGFTVKKISEFTDEFILLICFGTSLENVINHIFELNTKYDLIVPVVPVYGNDIFNRSFFENHYEEIIKTYDIIEPDSKTIFENCIKFTFTGRLIYLLESTSDKSEAFDILKLNHNESYLDIGAYKGETIDEFLNYTDNQYNSIVAIEPDVKNYKKLFENKSNLDNCYLLNSAVSSIDGFVPFSNNGGRQSHIDDSDNYIKSVSIDALNTKYQFSYIKIDAEGFESEIINGAIETLNRKPKLNIAIYHRSEDIFTIPNKIKQINPEYKIHLRKHPYIPLWDMNIYCV